MGIISCPSFLTNLSPQAYRLFQLTVDICFLILYANFTCVLLYGRILWHMDTLVALGYLTTVRVLQFRHLNNKTALLLDKKSPSFKYPSPHISVYMNLMLHELRPTCSKDQFVSVHRVVLLVELPWTTTYFTTSFLRYIYVHLRYIFIKSKLHWT